MLHGKLGRPGLVASAWPDGVMTFITGNQDRPALFRTGKAAAPTFAALAKPGEAV